jgi:hypothetical protein
VAPVTLTKRALAIGDAPLAILSARSTIALIARLSCWSRLNLYW